MSKDVIAAVRQNQEVIHDMTKIAEAICFLILDLKSIHHETEFRIKQLEKARDEASEWILSMGGKWQDVSRYR